MSGDIRSRILTGSFWSVLAELTAAAGRAFSYFIFAKLLSPNDYGIVGFCLLWINLLPLLIDNSLGLTLVSSKDDSQRTFSTIFYVNIGLSALGVAILSLCSGLAADFLGDGRVRIVLPVLGIWVLCNALCATHMAIARRRFQFNRLLPVRLISTFFSLAVGLPLAFRGFGYWALVAGTVAGGASQMIAAWILVPWRPALVFDFTRLRGLWGFTSWIAVDMGVTWLVMSGGGFFLAFFLGEHDLGFFRLSDQLDTAVMTTIFSPLIPVFYSAFCEAAGKADESKQIFERFNHRIAVLAVALTGFIIVSAHPLESLIGAKWNGIAGLLMVNAAADGISFLAILIPSFLRAHGRAETVARLRGAMFLGQLGVYSFTAPHGLEAFLWGKLALEAAVYVVSYMIIGRGFAIPGLKMVGDQVVIIGAMLLGAALSIAAATLLTHNSGLAGLLIAGVAFSATFGLFALYQERDTVLRLYRTISARYSVQG